MPSLENWGGRLKSLLWAQFMQVSFDVSFCKKDQLNIEGIPLVFPECVSLSLPSPLLVVLSVLAVQLSPWLLFPALTVYKYD